MDHKNKYYFLLILILFSSFPSYSRSVIADIFPRKINIDHNFKGISVLVYGSRNDAGTIAIAVRGPKKDYILRKKGKIAGIWTNIKSNQISDMYSFYATATMRPLSEIQNDTLMRSLKLGVDNLDYHIVVKDEDLTEFFDSENISADDEVNLLMQSKNLYTTKDYEIYFWGETLFKTFIDFPKNIIQGTYNIDIYLFNDGLLTSFQTLPIIVEQVGLEAFMFNFAHSHSVLYGIIAVSIALFIGWFASVLFRVK